MCYTFCARVYIQLENINKSHVIHISDVKLERETMRQGQGFGRAFVMVFRSHSSKRGDYQRCPQKHGSRQNSRNPRVWPLCTLSVSQPVKKKEVKPQRIQYAERAGGLNKVMYWDLPCSETRIPWKFQSSSSLAFIWQKGVQCWEEGTPV